MLESAARAERFDSRFSPPPYFHWEVPQKPVSVRISLDVVDRLDADAVRSFRSVTSRGSEIGGLLIGSVVPGLRPVIMIDDYEPVTCDYTRGPLYRLSSKDRERFDEAIRRHLAEPGHRQTVVGYFRSNTRKGLSLDADDMALFSEAFSGANNVALLVRPYASKPSVGAFFIWENGRVRAEASYQEFSFSRTELAGQSDGAAKPVQRAAVVPIAPRREAAVEMPPAAVLENAVPAVEAVPPAAPEPLVPEAPAAAAEPAAVIEIAPPAEPAPAVEPAPAAGTPAEIEAAEAAEPVVDVEPAGEAEPAVEASRVLEAPAVPEPEKASRPAAAAPDFEPVFSTAAEESTPGPGRKRLLWIAGIAAAAVLATGIYFLGPWRSDRRAAATAGLDSSPLALRVERTGAELLLTWNREAAAVKTAQRAMLFISDGERKESVEMDLSQLRNGSIVYLPATNDVNFRLEVVSKSAGKSQSEAVRVLGTRPSPMPPPAQSAQGTGGAPARPAAAGEESGEAEEEEAKPAGRVTPVRQWKGLPSGNSSLADRLRPTRAVEFAEPPRVGSADEIAARASALPSGMSAPPLPPAAPAPRQPAPGAETPAANHAPPTANVKVGGRVQAAELISRTAPVYPPLAKQARIQGVVTLDAMVGKDGKVHQVNVRSGHPLLRDAAIQAVKRWVYRPSQLNGEPVESNTQIEVKFDLAQ